MAPADSAAGMAVKEVSVPEVCTQQDTGRNSLQEGKVEAASRRSRMIGTFADKKARGIECLQALHFQSFAKRFSR